jgi:hypothetical protein
MGNGTGISVLVETLSEGLYVFVFACLMHTGPSIIPPEKNKFLLVCILVSTHTFKHLMYFCVKISHDIEGSPFTFNLA